jgi:ribonucleoside-diphosphate reductase alpha chain
MAVRFSLTPQKLLVRSKNQARKPASLRPRQRLAGIVSDILEKVIGVRKQAASVEQVQDTVEQVLMAADHFKTAKAYIIYRAEHANIRKAESIIGVENDLNLNINQLKVIERRYLMHDADGKPAETPGQMFRRVAKTLAGVEKTPLRKKWEQAFYEVMTKFEFLPAGRTLNNAGTPQNQLANCFVIPVEDSMEGIFDAVKWTAMVHQTGGGTGFNFSTCDHAATQSPSHRADFLLDQFHL